MRTIRLVILALVICCVLFVLSNPTYADVLRLTIQFDQSEYYVGEPVRLVGTLVNTSIHSLRIVEVSLLGSNMEYMYLSIVTPTGMTRKVRSRFSSSCMIVNPNYEGEPLPSGRSITTFLYPNVSISINPEDVGLGGPTFPVPGTYLVRLVYAPDPVYSKLRPGDSLEVISNVVALNFSEPDEGGREILDTIWRCCDLALTEGEMRSGFVGENADEELRVLIDKYSDHELARYAYFYLAKNFIYNAPQTKLDEAKSLIAELRTRWPEFRKEEAYLTLAQVYRCEKRPEEVLRVTSDALLINPGLRDVPDFMWERLVAEYGTVRAVSQWSKRRKQGVPKPDKNIVIE